MSRTTIRFLALALLAGLAACEPRPYLGPDYAVPAPAPLQPYMGAPAVPYVTHTVRRRSMHRYYRRRYHRVHCRCAPTNAAASVAQPMPTAPVPYTPPASYSPPSSYAPRNTYAPYNPATR